MAPSQSYPASQVYDDSTPCLLATHGNEILVRSAQGFMMVFRGIKFPAIARQLRNFDADEWRSGIDAEYHKELEGLSWESQYDASCFLEALPYGSLAQFNRDILDVAGSNLDFYNQLHSTTPFRIRARLQALTTLPMLKWEFCRMYNDTQRVRCRIDAGKNVWEAFLDIHPGKAAILRRIAASSAEPAAWRGKLADLLDILDPLPPEKVPHIEAEWNAFHSIYLGLALEGENDDDRRLVKRRWLVDCARLGWMTAFGRLAKIEGGVDTLADTFDFLDEVGHAGDAQSERDRDAGNRTSWERWRAQSRARWHRTSEALGLFRLVQASVRWHRLLWAEAGLSADSDGGRSTWPALLPESLTLEIGIRAVFLNTTHDLAEEGRRLGHCVGAYWRRCFVGESHIVSLRNNQNESLSTLEIRLPMSDSRTCQIFQHRAAHNSTPATQLSALENRICSAITQYADFNALTEWRRKAAILDSVLTEAERDSLLGKFSASRFKRLESVLGHNRLVSLFSTPEE